MRHKVELSQRAERDIEAAYAFLAEGSVGRATAWKLRLSEAIESLERFPTRHPLAPEAEEALVPVRQFIVGSHRILYIVEQDTVQILTVRHGARRFLAAEEIAGDAKNEQPLGPGDVA